MSFQSLAFFGFLAAALAVCLTAGRRSPRMGAALLAARLLPVCHGAARLPRPPEPARHHGRSRPFSRKRRMRPCARRRLSGLAT